VSHESDDPTELQTEVRALRPATPRDWQNDPRTANGPRLELEGELRLTGSRIELDAAELHAAIAAHYPPVSGAGETEHYGRFRVEVTRLAP
jgi:hypothetical protein